MLDVASAPFRDASHSALTVYRDFHRRGRHVEELREALPEVGRCESDGATVKFTLQLDGGLETESVLIPMRSRAGRSHDTLCVSSQVGCAMGCSFCETAQMGLMRNLRSRDIIAQWFAARHLVPAHVDREPADITNIVFMGMGEPMDNLDAVLGAIEIFTDRNGPGIAPANIAVSTVGRADGIRRYAAFAQRQGFRRLKLAVSVNAPNDAIRSSIMPINRATPMSELMDAMLEWAAEGTPVLIEYVIIPGVNDRDEHADELCTWLSPLPCKVNLIPYNPRRDSPWPAPDEATIERFFRRVREHGLFVTRRRTLGRGAMAACGQLGNPGVRRRRFVQAAADNTAIA